MVTDKMHVQNIRVHFISKNFIIRIYSRGTHDTCWYSIFHICWYTLFEAWKFITHNYWIINNTFKIHISLKNTCARLPSIICYARSILFTPTLRFIIISFLILIKCCVIKFAFKTAWRLFYQCFNFIYSCYQNKYLNIISFVLLGIHISVDKLSIALQFLVHLAWLIMNR